EIARTFNQVVARNEALTSELARLERVVGREGRMTERATLGEVAGSWKTSVDSINALIADLVQPTTEVARVLVAVAEGDLTQKMVLEIEGQPVKGEFLRIGTTVNAMVDQLSSFGAEVTRVAKEVVPMRRNSPYTGCPSISSAIFCVRSPSATATSTRATSVVGWTRSAIRALIESTEVFQDPVTSPSVARSVIRPSRPTTRSRRASSLVSASLRATTWLKVRAISAIRLAPRVNGSRTANSPALA